MVKTSKQENVLRASVSPSADHDVIVLPLHSRDGINVLIRSRAWDIEFRNL